MSSLVASIIGAATQDVRQQRAMIMKRAPDWVIKRLQKHQQSVSAGQSPFRVGSNVMPFRFQGTDEAFAEYLASNLDPKHMGNIAKDGKPYVRETSFKNYATRPTRNEIQTAVLTGLPVADVRWARRLHPSTGERLDTPEQSLQRFYTIVDEKMAQTKSGKALKGLMSVVDFVGERVVLPVAGVAGKLVADTAKGVAQGAMKARAERDAPALAQKQEAEADVEAFSEAQRGTGTITDIFRFFTGKYPQEKQWRAVLQQHGEATLTSARLFRAPVSGTLKQLVDWATGGKLSQEAKRQNYDQLFHLSLFLTLSDGSSWTLEKTAAPRITRGKLAYGLDAETLAVPVPSSISLRDLVGNALRAQTPQQFWVYNPFTANCQVFLRAMLNASGMLTPSANAFIVQDLASIAKTHPKTSKVLSGLTEVGAVFGRGLNTPEGVKTEQRPRAEREVMASFASLFKQKGAKPPSALPLSGAKGEARGGALHRADALPEDHIIQQMKQRTEDESADDFLDRVGDAKAREIAKMPVADLLESGVIFLAGGKKSALLKDVFIAARQRYNTRLVDRGVEEASTAQRRAQGPTYRRRPQPPQPPPTA